MSSFITSTNNNKMTNTNNKNEKNEMMMSFMIRPFLKDFLALLNKTKYLEKTDIIIR